MFGHWLDNRLKTTMNNIDVPFGKRHASRDQSFRFNSQQGKAHMSFAGHSYLQWQVQSGLKSSSDIVGRA